MNKGILFSGLILFSFWLQAQNSKPYTEKYMMKHPVWIEMIKNPEVNYFEAKKAFELFWKGKDQPVEEEEILGKKHDQEKRKKGFVYRLFNQKEETARKYAFEHKRFKHWMMTVEPYVQPDGRILSKEEQLKIWEQEKKRKQIGR
ncbi:MAG: hypothetical protein K1X92_05750 [Bacteroidia bacterium]|nr:hypothetical protein [Bacteroidia bacterium]